MKIVFALTPEQLARAKAIAASAPVFGEEDGSCFYAGNLLGDRSLENPCINTNQSLSLVDETVVYEGERHPLCQDGGLGVLWEIATGESVYRVSHPCDESAWAKLQVISYQTSDKRLRWFEVLQDYLQERASLEELLGEVEKRPGNWFADHFRTLVIQKGAPWAVKPMTASQETASFSKEELALRRRIQKVQASLVV